MTAVESCFCLCMVIIHEDNLTLGGHLFLNVYTNQLPAHPSVHPSTVSLRGQSGQWSRDKRFGCTIFSPGQYVEKENISEYWWCQGIIGTHYTAVFLAKALIILMCFSPAGCPWICLSEHQQRIHPFTPRPPSFGMYSCECANFAYLETVAIRDDPVSHILLGCEGYQALIYRHPGAWGPDKSIKYT